MHSSGQSGFPWSKWYQSFVQSWVQVDYVPVWNSEPPVGTLTLKPGA
jgi:acyl-homoserine lactone acylase PvdQ